MEDNRTKFVVKRAGQNDDELMHWKYVDKIKLPSGKWRYIYEKAVGNLGGYQKKTMDKAGREYSRAQDSFTQNKAALNRMKRSYARPNAISNQNQKVTTARKTMQSKGRAFVKAQNEFMKTPLGVASQIGSAVSKAISAGKSFLSKLFSKKKTVTSPQNDTLTFDSPKKKSVVKRTNVTKPKSQMDVTYESPKRKTIHKMANIISPEEQIRNRRRYR